MTSENINNLVVIEDGLLTVYDLDDKNVWEVGRMSKYGKPDIRLNQLTISRKHGKFENMDGIWFYVDYNGKNGTIHNGKHIESGYNGRIKPVLLNDRDIFIFGANKEELFTSKSVWAMFLTRKYGEYWKVINTKGCEKIKFSYKNKEMIIDNKQKGNVEVLDDAIIICMGDFTYVSGNIIVIE